MWLQNEFYVIGFNLASAVLLEHLALNSCFLHIRRAIKVRKISYEVKPIKLYQDENKIPKLGLQRTLNLQVKPVVPIVQSSLHEHILKGLKVDIVIGEEETRVVEVGDAGILGIPADVDNLATSFEQGRWKHGDGHVSFDDAR